MVEPAKPADRQAELVGSMLVAHARTMAHAGMVDLLAQTIEEIIELLADR